MRLLMVPAIVSAFMLASCTLPPVLPQTVGPHSLPQEDIQQIAALVAARADIRKPIQYLQVNQPDRVVVYSGRHERIGDITTHFTVRKKHGRWSIDEASFGEER